MIKLNKNKAIELITPVVDNEATTAEKEAFYAYISRDLDVRHMYEAEKQIKELIRTKTRKVPAPESLRTFVKKLPDYYGLVDIPDDNNQLFLKNTPSRGSQFRSYILAIAALLLLSFGLFTYRGGQAPMFEDVYLEPVTLKHFNTHKERSFPMPDFYGITRTEAEAIIEQHMGKNMTVPPLAGAEFHGMFMPTFSGNFETPLLVYRTHENTDDFIFIFAFDLDSMASYLHRNEEAVKTCQKFEDYHIVNIQGSDIVSWKWERNWYTAVSQHDGATIAGMLPIH